LDEITVAQVVLTYLTAVLVIILSIAGMFFIKFVIDLNRLIVDINEISTLIKHELQPTLEELRQTLQNLNAIAGKTNKQFENVRSIIGKVAGLSGLLLGQVQSVTGGFMKGLFAGIQLFSKRK